MIKKQIYCIPILGRAQKASDSGNCRNRPNARSIDVCKKVITLKAQAGEVAARELFLRRMYV